MKRGVQLYLDIELVERARRECAACGMSLSEAVSGLLELFLSTGGNGETTKENHNQGAADPGREMARSPEETQERPDALGGL